MMSGTLAGLDPAAIAEGFAGCDARGSRPRIGVVHMRIVVLDDMDIGAENLARLESRGDVRVYAGVPADDDEIVARARGAEVVLCSWTQHGRRASSSACRDCG